MDLFAILFVSAQETAAAHGGFKGAGDFDDLVVIQNIRIHPFAGAFQRKLFDIVIRVVWFQIYPFTLSKDQFREHRCFVVFA